MYIFRVSLDLKILKVVESGKKLDILNITKIFVFQSKIWKNTYINLLIVLP